MSNDNTNSDQKKQEQRTTEWEMNHVLIHDKFLELLKAKKGRKPTNTELAEECGFSRSTIAAHIKGIKFEPATDSARFLTNDVLMAIFQSALKGGARSQKLWFEITEGLSQKVDVTNRDADPINKLNSDELSRELQARLDRLRKVSSEDGSDEV